jgi:DNA-binding HxlR family transcriptional regulator
MTERVSTFCSRLHRAVELIGRRWTGAIIQSLLGGPMRYGELRASIPDINDRMLSERLRELESEEIVVRRVVPDTPVRVEYELTEKGRGLDRAMGALGEWASAWLPASVVTAAGATDTVSRAASAPRKRKRA